MSSKFGEILYVDTPYRPDSGSFCKAKSIEGNRHKVGQWYYCRDLFHGQLYNLKLFFFSHDLNKGHCVAAFMRKVENLLNATPRSSFGPTQRKKIMWVQPSRWWTVNAMRRSLFTILLRAGSQYSPSKDNFISALYSDFYTLGSIYAVERFFAGNTIYTGKVRGWFKQFGDTTLTEERIDSLLIKPEK